MKNFTMPELLKSLAFPILTLVCGVWNFLGVLWHLLFYEQELYRIVITIFWAFAVIFGGVLPILMTVKFNVRTERYFFKRVISFAVCLGAIYLMNHTIYHTGVFGGIYIMVVIGSKVVYQLLKVEDKETTGVERAVMFLSDYIIIYGLDVFILKLRDLADLDFIRL